MNQETVRTYEELLKGNENLESWLKVAVEAALAYQKLSACYRLGKQPSEKLFKELEKANKTLEEYEKIKEQNEN